MPKRKILIIIHLIGRYHTSSFKGFNGRKYHLGESYGNISNFYTTRTRLMINYFKLQLIYLLINHENDYHLSM
jgi:hypothetical protein